MQLHRSIRAQYNCNLLLLILLLWGHVPFQRHLSNSWWWLNLLVKIHFTDLQTATDCSSLPLWLWTYSISFFLFMTNATFEFLQPSDNHSVPLKLQQVFSCLCLFVFPLYPKPLSLPLHDYIKECSCACFSIKLSFLAHDHLWRKKNSFSMF